MEGVVDAGETRYTKAVMLSEIERAWAALNDALDGLTPQQMTEIRDPQGWAVKDHLGHISAWERSVVVFLRGGPRHEGLGIDEQLYLAGDDDAINAAIQAKQKDVSLPAALADMREVHSQLLRLIEPLSDADLYKANSDYRVEQPEERDERPLIGMIYSNTAPHFKEHQDWIASLVAQER